MCFIIFVNRAQIIWFSKRQNTVESSTFSSGFIAMRTCMEHITALRYKLRMFGVPEDYSAKVLCDNESVVRNSSRLDSSLNRKHCALAYHAVRRAVAADIAVIGWVPTGLNLADALTKRLTVQAREELFGSWTCYSLSNYYCKAIANLRGASKYACNMYLQYNYENIIHSRQDSDSTNEKNAIDDKRRISSNM